MPIEFACSGCKARLRVPDTAAGKKAKCPHCSAVIEVPLSAAAEPTLSTATPADPFTTGRPNTEDSPNSFAADRPAHDQNTSNPYASPSLGTETEPKELETMTPQPFEAKQAFGDAYKIFQKNMWILVGAYVVQIVIGWVVGLAFLSAETILFETDNVGIDNVELSRDVKMDNGKLTYTNPKARALESVEKVISGLINVFFTIGFAKMLLDSARGKTVEMNSLFGGGRHFLRFLVSSILFGIAAALGLLLFIAPGIFVLLRFWTFGYFIIDRDAGVIESFELAAKYNKGNASQVFLIGLFSIGLWLVGFLMLCFGILFTVPLMYQMYLVAYLMMTGQTYVVPGRPISYGSH